MSRLAVLGQPVAHSRSPAMQNAALAELGLAPEWSYEAIEVAPGDFAELVRSLPERGFAGVNVTVPHKLAALAVADRASEAARQIGAANTLTFADAEIAADNTDATGLIAALPGSPAGRRALVLGAGGAGRACAWALREAGAEVGVWNRTGARAAQLASELEITHVEQPAEFDLLVNATTVGMAESGTNREAANRSDLKPLPVRADALSETKVVVDLVYGPSPTPLAEVARRRGASVVDGLEILVHQGAEALRIWTGMDPPLETMREAARKAQSTDGN
jgi:shikimate dehydrogenase